MLRWNAERDEKVDSERADAYVEELIAVGRKYGVSLYHARPRAFSSSARFPKTLKKS